MLKKALLISVFAFLIFLISYPLFHAGFFPIHDDIQTMRLYEMDKCIRDWQIPCRWVPDMGYGYGYPQFNYYAPLPYYIMEIPHLLGLSIVNSVKFGFFLSFLISAIAMYLFGKKLWGRWGGFISSIFYLYLPYRAVNIYVRGDIDEVWAMGILPFIFLSVYKISMKEKNGVLWLALSLSAILTTHNVTTLISAPFIFLWIIFCINQFTAKNEIHKFIKKYLLGGLWGIAISSFFLLPAWFEKNLVHVDSLTMGYFNYLAHFVGLKQLLFSNFIGYGTSELGPYDGLNLSIGLFWWLLAVLILIWLYFLRFKEKRISGFFLYIGLVSLFMIHPRSTPIWNALPILSFVQFPWRFLLVAGFSFSVVIGGFPLFFRNNKKLLFGLFSIFILFLVLFYQSDFKPSKYLDVNDEQKFSGDSWGKQQTISIFDYLPVSAEKPPTKPAPDSLISNTGGITENFHKYGSDWKVWDLNVSENLKDVSLPIIYFPGWKVNDNGVEAKLLYSGNGIININIDKGHHVIYAYFGDTPIRKFSNILSMFSILLIPLYLDRKVYLKKE